MSKSKTLKLNITKIKKYQRYKAPESHNHFFFFTTSLLLATISIKTETRLNQNQIASVAKLAVLMSLGESSVKKPVQIWDEATGEISGSHSLKGKPVFMHDSFLGVFLEKEGKLWGSFFY